MAVICSFCGTENRAVARFCIECIGPLSPDFEPTQVLSRHAPADGSASTGAPTAFADFAATPSPAEPRAPAIARKAAGAEPRKGLWLSVAAFAITLAIAAGGWMIAGAGGWYIYSAAKAVPETQPAALLIPVEDAAAPASQQVSTAPRALETAVSPSPVQLPVATLAPASLPTPETPAVPEPPAVQLPTQAQAPATPPTRPRPAAATPRDVGRTAHALAQCAELGFLARSRCMVAQCAKAEHSATAACGPVLTQQRLMEEKRNPVMAN